MFRSVRIGRPVVHGGGAILHSRWQRASESSRRPAASPALGVSVLDLGHHDRGTLLCRRFNLRFPNDTGCGVPFYVLICHLQVFFDEVSVQIFCLFFNWVVSFLIVDF